ncbi:hypothetical protein ACFE04_016132 [Oxalis oulophora]
MTNQDSNVLNLGGSKQDFNIEFSYACHDVSLISSRGIWYGDDPLNYTVPILLLQGGLILGPSFLGYDTRFASKVFPIKDRTVLETLSVFGFMLFSFLIGVKIDPTLLFRSHKRALVIGVLGFVIPYAFSGLTTYILQNCLTLDPEVSKALPLVASVQSMSAFPVIACFLAEQQILNSEIGHLALSSSMVCDIWHWTLSTIHYLINFARTKSIDKSLGLFFSNLLLITIIVFAIRPAALWAIHHTPEGKPVKEIYILVALVVVLVCGLLGEVVGLSAFAGCFLVGLVIPDGPPLGAALVERLDCFVSVMLMPIFFTIFGLKMNIFAIQNLKNVGVFMVIVIVAFIGKIIATATPPLFFRMPIRDALSLGLIMNSQGIIELALLSSWKETNVINEECFAMMVMTLVFITGVVSALVKALYDPSRRFIAYRRRTLQHHPRNEELRILSCIHSEDNVKAMIGLIDSSNPSEECPVKLFVLHLVKLAGQASSQLIPYLPRDKTSQYPTESERFFDAFRKFEQKNDHLTVHCYKGISPYATMHNDVCSLALEQRTSFIILPFHKKAAYGKNVQSSHVYRHLSWNVLDKAPCSVGILLNRVTLRKPRLVNQEPQIYRVVVLFFGGADDREALAYSLIMSEHNYVLVSVLRFSSHSGQIVSGSPRSSMLDDEMLSEFKAKALHNERLMSSVEMITEGTDVLAVIKSLDDAYDLVMVGRHHSESALLDELKKLNQHVELGTVGEAVGATNFKNAPSVLVVHQQRRVWGMRDPEESTHVRRVQL